MRRNVVLNQEDEDILTFFKEEGMGFSQVVRVSMKRYYDWYLKAVRTVKPLDRGGFDGRQIDDLEPRRESEE